MSRENPILLILCFLPGMKVQVCCTFKRGMNDKINAMEMQTQIQLSTHNNMISVTSKYWLLWILTLKNILKFVNVISKHIWTHPYAYLLHLYSLFWAFNKSSLFLISILIFLPYDAWLHYNWHFIDKTMLAYLLHDVIKFILEIEL